MLRHKTHIGWKQRTEKHILSNRKHKRTDIIPDKKNHQDKEYYKRPKGIFHDKRINSSQEGIAILSIYVPNMEKVMAPHSSTLAWKIPWTEEPGRLRSMGSRRVGHDWATSLSLSLSCIGEGNGNPLQCSCLENPRDGGAWWAAVYRVAQSQTRLKRLSSSSSSSIGLQHVPAYLSSWNSPWMERQWGVEEQRGLLLWS